MDRSWLPRALVAALIVLTGVVSGCREATGEATLTTTTEAVTSAVVSGYVHTLAKSRFAMGTGLSERTEFGFLKTIGEHGVFATLVLRPGRDDQTCAADRGVIYSGV